MTVVEVADVLCVYYKVDASQHAAVAPRVQQFQAALSSDWPGLVCELLQRPEVTAGVETWMETYRYSDRYSDRLSAALVDAVAQSAVTAELPAPRHVERFVSLLSPCAEPRSSLKNP